MEVEPGVGSVDEGSQTTGEMGPRGAGEHETSDQGCDDDASGLDRREEFLGLAGCESAPCSEVDSPREGPAMLVLDPWWRKQAQMYVYPKPFGFPGKIIGVLLAHIDTLESQATPADRIP